MADTAIITDTGLTKLAAAAGGASAVAISHVALGDGGGAAYEPDFEATALQGEQIRREIDSRVQVEPKSWLTRVTFPADVVPSMVVREIGFFDADGDLIVIVAGDAFAPRTLGGFDYSLNHVLNFDRAAEGAVIVAAPDDDLYEHILIDLEAHAMLADQQLAAQLERQDIRDEMQGRDADIQAEATTRAAADATLANDLAAEGDARVAEDAALDQKISAEAAARSAEDAALGVRIDAEATARADALFGAVPPGAVMPFAMAAAPAGWLACNGATVSRATYAALFAAIGETYGEGDGATTFNLPDLRGEFVRGWDNGRGVDAGRAIGSAQADDFASHTHATGMYGPRPADGSSSYFVNLDSAYDALETEAAGGDETRPRNIALQYCIRV